MMHPYSNINTSNNLYDPLRVLEENNCYYYYSSPSFFPSSPSLYNGFLHEDFLENHHEIIQQKQQQNSLENIKNDDDNCNKSKRVGLDKPNSPRKKISKKDRHTKIETAQGPRDRRMRLSLNIARKFFDLQDMLGFDKASKTVEWLLTNSHSAITELSTNFQQIGANSSLSCSTSEMFTDELSSSNGNLEKGYGMANGKNSEAKKGNKKAVRTIRPLAKESREKARERARERTMKKRSNLQKKREFIAGTTNNVVAGNEIDAGCWIPSTTTFLNYHQNGGIIDELTIPELDHVYGHFGEACIW